MDLELFDGTSQKTLESKLLELTFADRSVDEYERRKRHCDQNEFLSSIKRYLDMHEDL